MRTATTSYGRTETFPPTHNFVPTELGQPQLNGERSILAAVNRRATSSLCLMEPARIRTAQILLVPLVVPLTTSSRCLALCPWMRPRPARVTRLRELDLPCIMFVLLTFIHRRRPAPAEVPLPFQAPVTAPALAASSPEVTPSTQAASVDPLMECYHTWERFRGTMQEEWGCDVCMRSRCSQAWVYLTCSAEICGICHKPGLVPNEALTH